MGNASTEVQQKLDESSLWFVHAQTVKSLRTFTLEQILEISLEAARKTQRGYEPKIHTRTEGDLQLPAANLVFIHDALFVALGNVARHSGLKAPNIDITCRSDSDNDTLEIEVISECKLSLREQKAADADKSRERIEGGASTDVTRLEGGTGFAKLAAVINQNSRANLSFGFMDDGKFRLQVVYAIIRPAELLTEG